MNFSYRMQLSAHPVRALMHALLVGSAWALGTAAVLPGTLSNANCAHAQNTNATIRGQVLDPSGALVPNAQVVIVNKETGVTVFNGQSDTAGTFVAPQVIPGKYKIAVSAPGLKQSVIDNLIATVAQIASVHLQLYVDTA